MSKGKAKDFVKEVKEETAENEETSKEEFFKEKKDKKSVFERVINVVLWVVLFAWVLLLFFFIFLLPISFVSFKASKPLLLLALSFVCGTRSKSAK